MQYLNYQLSAEDAAHYEPMITYVLASFPNSIGALMVSHDGTIVANYLPENIDPKPIGDSAAQAFKNSKRLADQIYERIPYMILSVTSQEYALITLDMSGSFLLVISISGVTTDLLAAIHPFGHIET